MAVTAVAGLASVGGQALGAYLAGTAFTMGMAMSAFAIGAGMSMVSRALMPKPDAGVGLEGLQNTVRNPVSSRKMVYGEMRTGGTIVYIQTDGTDNKYLHMAIVWATHQIESIDEIYFNEEVIWKSSSLYQGLWGNYVTHNNYLGTQTLSDPLLDNAFVTWTADHKLEGVAYTSIRMEWNADQFQNGIPTITAKIKGKWVLDPRTNTTAFSKNPALCLYDYMRDSAYGLGEDAANFNTQSVIDAANICDETDTEFTGARYELNGVLDTANKVKENIEALTSAMAGHVAFSGGEFFIYAGAYRTPFSQAFDETHLVGDIQLSTKQSRRSLYNAVKGVFVSSGDDYIATDYPAQISSTYSTEDGDPIYLDMPLPFTTEQDRAQRLAKIALLRSRQQKVITMPMNMAALQFKAGDTIKVTNEKLGFTNKVFEVIGYDIRVGEQIIVDVQAIETDAGLYDWTTSDEQPYVFTGETPNYDGTPVAPTSLQLNSYTHLQADGTHTVYVDASWTASVDAFIDFYRFKYTVDGVTTSVDTRDTSHRFLATSGSEYTVTVTAFNLLSRESSTLSGTITPVADTTAPSDPASVTATGGVKSITLTWDNPTESDFKHVEIFYSTNEAFSIVDWTPSDDGTAPLAKVDGESFVLSGLTAGDTYKFWVRAVDFTGNKTNYITSVDAVASAVTVAAGTDVTVDLSNTTGQVDNTQIGDEAVDTLQIANNAVDITKIADTLQSTNYVAGTSGWKLTTDGTFEAGDALFRGSVTATNLDLTGSATIAGSITATSIVAGGVTYDMLSPEAVNELQNRIGNGSAGDFKTASATIPTTITLGTFTHGTKQVETTVNASKTGYHYQSYTLAQRTVNWTIEKTVAGQSNWGFVDSGSIVLNQFDLTASVPNTYYHTVNYTNHSYENDTAGDYTYRIVFSSVGSAFSDPNISVSVTLSANEESSLSIDTSDFISKTTTTAQSIASSLTVTGNLTVNGTTTTLNTATLDVEDKNITLNYGAGDTSASANGAGITIQDAVNSTTNATLTWNATNDQWVFSHPVKSSTITTLTSYDTLPEGVYGSVNTSVGPFANHHTIISYDNPASAGRKNQLFFPDSNEAFYFRNRQGDTTGWHPWHRVWSDLDFSSTSVTNWDTAYGWGDHDGLYLPIGGGALTGDTSISGDLTFTGTATTTNQSYGIFWTGFDKEGTTDFSDNAYIIHTVNTGGHTGSVLLFSSQNDSGDGIAFSTHASSRLKHNSYNIWTEKELTTTNKSNYDTAYTYSQVGHLPLAGGTMTGNVKFTLGTSNLMFESDTNSGFIPYACQYRQDGTVTGAIKIEMPDAVDAPDDMITMWVDIMDYASGESVSVYIAGYNYTTSSTSTYWYNTTAMVLSPRSDRQYKVTWGYESGRKYVAIGETTSTWNDMGVVVRDVQLTYRADVDQYPTDWDIDIVTTLGGVDESKTATYPYAYPVDNTNEVKLGGIKIGGASSAENYISFYGTTGDQNGNYNHSYIGERIYDGTEKSELVIAKYNDVEGASGSDRVRVIGNNFQVDTYTAAITPAADASLETAATTGTYYTRFKVRQNGDIEIGGSKFSDSSRNLTNIGSISATGDITGATLKSNNATALQMYGGGSGTYNQGVLYCNSTNLVLEAPLVTDSASAARVPIRISWRGGYSSKGGIEIGDGYTAVNSLKIGGTTAIDSSRGSLYLNSSNAGAGNGIFFRDGFSYNCSITAEDHNGNFADGIHIQGYDGVTIGTGANTKQTKLAIDLNGHATFYNNLTVNGSFTTNNGRVMKSLGGTGDYVNYVIPLIQLSGHSGASDESTFIGHITAWRGNALYNPCRIEISCQRVYNSQNYKLTYERSGTINLEPVTFNYNGIKYLGVKLNPSAAMTYGGVNVDGHHTGTRPTLQLIAYYRSNDATVLNSEINSTITSAGNGGEYRFGGTVRMQGDLSSDGSFYCLGKADFQGDAAIEGGSGWGMFKGYTGNYNHFITSRGIVTGTTSSPSITGGHETTLVEYCNTDSSGFVFKRSDTGTYTEIARITRTGITSQGDVTAYSDVKLKDNIATVSNALEKVMQLRGVTYTRKDLDDKSKVHLGVIAQEVELVLPEAVHYNEIADVKTVSYGNMVGVLIEAIKEQQSEIEELKALVKKLLEK